MKYNLSTCYVLHVSVFNLRTDPKVPPAGGQGADIRKGPPIYHPVQRTMRFNQLRGPSGYGQDHAGGVKGGQRQGPHDCRVGADCDRSSRCTRAGFKPGRVILDRRPGEPFRSSGTGRPPRTRPFAPRPLPGNGPPPPFSPRGSYSPRKNA
jgi:hypothetical protein